MNSVMHVVDEVCSAQSWPASVFVLAISASTVLLQL